MLPGKSLLLLLLHHQCSNPTDRVRKERGVVQHGCMVDWSMHGRMVNETPQKHIPSPLLALGTMELS